MKTLLWYLVVCGVVFFGRGLFASAKTSGHIDLPNPTGAGDARKLVVDYHQASLAVMPYGEPQSPIDLAVLLGKLEPTIDRKEGCGHLWDMLRITRRLPIKARHSLYSRALYNMSICEPESAQSRSWLTLAEYEAFWSKQFKTSLPEVAHRQNDLYEKIMQRKRLIDSASNHNSSSAADGNRAEAKGE